MDKSPTTRIRKTQDKSMAIRQTQDKSMAMRKTQDKSMRVRMAYVGKSMVIGKPYEFISCIYGMVWQARCHFKLMKNQSPSQRRKNCIVKRSWAVHATYKEILQ